MPKRVFLSYSQRDEALREELSAHLDVLQTNGTISTWHARRIGAGEDWRTAIDCHLDAADIVLVLVSADFLASEYCRDIELRRALERHKSGAARMIPILLRPCLWDEAPFAHLSPLPDNAQPITRWLDRDEGWLNVVQAVRSIIRAADPKSEKPYLATPQQSEAATNLASPITRPVDRLVRELEAAQAERDVQESRGGNVAPFKARILELKHRLRAGGQLRQNDSLGDGRYFLLRPLGRGGFATVWEADDRQSATRVAIKVLHPQLASEASRRERFFRGARAMAELAHPNIVRILVPYEEDAEFFYFVMELVAGLDLHKTIHQNRLPRDAIISVILSAGEALSAAHAKGFVHRDVSPHNILLDNHGRVKLSDFDLAITPDSSGGTRTGAMGKFLYAAPEVMSRPQEADARADVFGLGMTAIFCLHGADLPGEIIRRPEKFLARLNWEPVAKILLQAIEWDAKDRCPTIGEFCDALSHAAQSQPIVQGRASDSPSEAGTQTESSLVSDSEAADGTDESVGQEPTSGQIRELIQGAAGSRRRRGAAVSLGFRHESPGSIEDDQLSLNAWALLESENHLEALALLKSIVRRQPEDAVSWEGIRLCADVMQDHAQEAIAYAHLGSLVESDERGGEFWERAGAILLEKTDAHEDADIAFERAFERDPRRRMAFERLWRSLRARNEDDRLLSIINRRLEVVEDEQETLKMFWERARVLRKKGDVDGALAALEDVTMLEPDHVGALALSGEIQIAKHAFDKAAPLLARLAEVERAPKQQRLMSGVAAADLYEGKLQKPEKALEVLAMMHKAGLSSLPIRERLAKVAAKVGAWEQATSILELLMREREKKDGRIEAARLAMAIYTDKLRKPLRAEAAVAKLLEESPDDGEAVDLVLVTNFDAPFRSRVLGRAKFTIVHALAQNPCDPDRVALLAKIANAGQDLTLRQATLGALVSLGRNDGGIDAELERLDAQMASRPQIMLDAAALAEIADPEDTGAIAELFVAIGETISLALGPSLASLGVTKKDKIDARGAPPLRWAIAAWTGAVGIGEWELYVGGTDPNGVSGVAGEEPAIVVGANIKTPLSPAARSAIAREVFALRRGITSLRHRDDATVASLVAVALQEAGINVPIPPHAEFQEIRRAFRREISPKVKSALPDIALRVAGKRQDSRTWAQAARHSIDRMALIAVGDVSLVLSDVLGVPRRKLGARVPSNDRAKRLLGFVLSASYVKLRTKLGLSIR